MRMWFCRYKPKYWREKNYLTMVLDHWLRDHQVTKFHSSVCHSCPDMSPKTTNVDLLVVLKGSSSMNGAINVFTKCWCGCGYFTGWKVWPTCGTRWILMTLGEPLTVHPLVTTDMCAKFHGNPSNSCLQSWLKSCTDWLTLPSAMPFAWLTKHAQDLSCINAFCTCVIVTKSSILANMVSVVHCSLTSYPATLLHTYFT